MVFSMGFVGVCMVVLRSPHGFCGFFEGPSPTWFSSPQKRQVKSDKKHYHWGTMSDMWHVDFLLFEAENNCLPRPSNLLEGTIGLTVNDIFKQQLMFSYFCNKKNKNHHQQPNKHHSSPKTFLPWLPKQKNTLPGHIPRADDEKGIAWIAFFDDLILHVFTAFVTSLVWGFPWFSIPLLICFVVYSCTVLVFHYYLL